MDGVKIIGHVLAVHDRGDEIEVTAQGSAVRAADWQSMTSITFRIPANDTAKRTYHLGRKVEMEITPK